METGSKREQLVIGARGIKDFLGRYLLQGLVASAFLHSALIAVVGLWPHEKVEKRDVVIIIDPPGPRPPRPDDDKQVMPPRPKPPQKPDLGIFTPVENEPVTPDTLSKMDDSDYPPLSGPYDPDATIDTSMAYSGGGSDGYDTSVIAGVYQPTPEYIFRDIEPQALLDISPQPEYPKIARIAGTEGSVRVWVRVNEKGNVTNWQVIDVHPVGLGFEDEVARVIPKWKFTPAVANNRPIAVWVAIPFRFSVEP